MTNIKMKMELTLACSSFYDDQNDKAIHVWPKDDDILIGIDIGDKKCTFITLSHEKANALSKALQSPTPKSPKI